MSLRTSLQKLIGRDPAASLRERAADLQARIPAPRPPAAEPSPSPVHAEQVAQAGLTGDALAGGGIDHRDGTVSYADATGKVSRRPVAHWIAFTALQMHNRVQHEMARRRIVEAGDLSAEAHAVWEARIRRELRSDAVHALTFRHDRAFEAAQAIRTGAEPNTAKGCAETDAMLLALAPEWDAARDAYDEASQRQLEITAAAEDDNRPGPPPDSSAPGGVSVEWKAWFQRCQEWRERTGIDAAEEASGAACHALGEVEDRIAALPAASLAGLRLKARVAQRNQDIGVDWPQGLGEGLARDILAFGEPIEAPSQPALKFDRSISDRIDFAAASLNELVALHDTAKLVGDVAQAAVWQGRCKAPSAQNPYASTYNAAGELMVWLSDELTHVEHLACEEMKKRRPTDLPDRERRLAWIAAPIIQNGDTTETAAFVGDLATWLADDRGD